MNIGERLMTPRTGESAREFQKRQMLFRQKCEEVFSTPAARDVLSDLIHSHHPLQPRTNKSMSAHESAFLDGELSLLSFLLLNSGQTDLLSIPPADLVSS